MEAFMNFARTLGALALATALTTGAAQAADLYTPDPAVAYASPGFDWDGFYAGIGGSGSFYNTGVSIGTVELEAGVNFTSGDFLFGVEALAGWGFNSIGANSGIIGAEARAGYLVDPSVLLYLSAGGVHYFNGSSTFGTLGAGVEFVVSDNVTYDVEYKYLWNSAALNGHEIGASVLWHF